MNDIFETAMQKGFEKITAMNCVLKGFPHITKEGKWLENQNGHWTGGFWTGLNWLHFLVCSDENAKIHALELSKKLAVRQNDNTTHDQGFIFGPSCVLGYRITADEELKKLAFSGARNMVDLYDENVGLVRAWAETGYERIAIVDTIMNLPLMVWATQNGEQDIYSKLADSTSKVIAAEYIRSDYSTYHVVRWDKNYQMTGGTHQGYGENTCWSRGQAWALYGYANMYRYTAERQYLEISIKLADYFIEHLEDSFLAKWDFHFKGDSASLIDSSACSIAASGLLLISALCGDIGLNEEKLFYKNSAEKILKSLIENCLYTDIDEYGILKNAVVDLPRSSGINESTMYGDYYFIEALYRIRFEADKQKLELLY